MWADVEQVAEITETPITMDVETLKLIDVMSAKMLAHRAAIEEMCAAAMKEDDIQTRLRKLQVTPGPPYPSRKISDALPPPLPLTTAPRTYPLAWPARLPHPPACAACACRHTQLYATA